MILTHHFGQALGAQTVSQRPGRVISQTAGLKQVGHAVL